MSDHRSILIVGGGFSGAALAIQLARRNIASTLIEGRGEVARGAAYSTRNDEHLLNVPAGKMGLSPDAVGGFAAHVEGDGLGPQDFVSRRRFGEYVAAELAAVAANGGVEIVRDRAIAARPTAAGWRIDLTSGGSIDGAGLVLANGNQPPAPVPIAGLSSRSRVEDPWSDDGRRRIADAARGTAPVLMVGTGLTMVDVVLTLDRLGFVGPMVALSRRGQVPRAHLTDAVTPVTTAVDDVPQRLSDAVRWLRRRSAETGSWRAAIDGLRPVTQAIWQRMTKVQRERFLRHLRPWWDVHRHRIAPQAADVIRRLVAEGRLQLLAGRALGAEQGDGVETIAVARRGGDRVDVPAALVVNCTGPLAGIAQTNDPLLRQMLAEGLARPDELGLGLEVDGDDRLIGQERVWGIGPVTKGRHWEITAVPDIRVQAERIAEDIAETTFMSA